jgi:hypothetical protein
MGFWRRNRGQSEWPEPPAEYLSGLVESVRHSRRQARHDARRGGFTLGLAPAAVLAVVLSLAAVVGVGTATGAGGGVVRAVKSFVVNSNSNHGDNNSGKSAKHGKDDDEGANDDNDDNGQYDQYDEQCQNNDNERRLLARQQSSERQQLLQAQTAPHPGLTGSALRNALAQERLALAEHQQAALRVLSAKHDRCNGDNGNGDHGNGDHGNGDHGGGGHHGGGGGNND